MQNKETCNAPKCLKPSGLIDWINCTLCNEWVHIKCANLSRTEVRSLAEYKCSRCSLVNTIPQCQDDNFEFTPQILTTTPSYRIDWWKEILQTFCNIFWIFNFFSSILVRLKNLYFGFLYFCILNTFELILTICVCVFL